jgi:hypothetical protein
MRVIGIWEKDANETNRKVAVMFTKREATDFLQAVAAGSPADPFNFGKQHLPERTLVLDLGSELTKETAKHILMSWRTTVDREKIAKRIKRIDDRVAQLAEQRRALEAGTPMPKREKKDKALKVKETVTKKSRK